MNASDSSVFQVDSAQPAMTRCISPEERASSVLASCDVDEAMPRHFASIQQCVARAIREAEASARLKAFDEAEAILGDELSRQEKVLAESNALMKKLSPDAARALSESPPPSSYQRVRNVLDRLREGIRARAEEAPRG